MVKASLDKSLLGPKYSWTFVPWTLVPLDQGLLGQLSLGQMWQHLASILLYQSSRFYLSTPSSFSIRYESNVLLKKTLQENAKNPTNMTTHSTTYLWFNDTSKKNYIHIFVPRHEFSWSIWGPLRSSMVPCFVVP